MSLLQKFLAWQLCNALGSNNFSVFLLNKWCLHYQRHLFQVMISKRTNNPKPRQISGQGCKAFRNSRRLLQFLESLSFLSETFSGHKKPLWIYCAILILSLDVMSYHQKKTNKSWLPKNTDGFEKVILYPVFSQESITLKPNCYNSTQAPTCPQI